MYVEYIIYIPKNKYIALVLILFSFYIHFIILNYI